MELTVVRVFSERKNAMSAVPRKARQYPNLSQTEIFGRPARPQKRRRFRIDVGKNTVCIVGGYRRGSVAAATGTEGKYKNFDGHEESSD